MPGAAGSATAPGQLRISASNSPLEISGDAAIIPAGGTITSPPLRTIGLPGLSVNVDRLNSVGDPITVQVQVRVGPDSSPWINLGIPCCCDPAVLTAIPAGAGGLAFVSWDHLAVRQARMLITGTPGNNAGFVLLMTAAT